MESYIRVLGSCGWQPTKGNDYSCYTLNDRCLIDICAAANQHLLDHDVDPSNINTVLFTHMHFDHHAGLASFLYYNRVMRNKELGNMTFYGPKDTLPRSMKQALMYVFHTEENMQESITQMPRVVELEGSGMFEMPGFEVRYMPSDHAVPGFCYRVKDLSTGHEIGFSGDTRYFDKLPEFFKNVDVLVHEVSHGAGPVDEIANSKPKHSSAREAAKVCNLSGAKKLVLTHTFAGKREAALQTARELTLVPVEWAMPGTKIIF